MMEATEQMTQEEISKLLSIDLTTLPAHVLTSLKEKVSEALEQVYRGRIGDDDIVLHYDIKIRTKDGIVSDNCGDTKMNRVLSQRLIVDAPRRFESEFMHQVYEPTYADAMELFDTKSGKQNSLTNIKQSIGNYDLSEALPGLPAFG